VLDTVLGKLARQHDANVLVGFDKADDAGVYKLDDRIAIVQTVDFFTPIVDDPYTFGQIAAVNALSDVYAMGGRPMSSLALVCFPDKEDTNVLENILAGGLSKMIEAGCTVIGGHSVRDAELKFGYSVTGTIDPSRIFTNAKAKPGDALILTKALGTGVISTAIKREKAQTAWMEAATRSMTTLNKIAAELMASEKFHCRACTDVTGFGLIGHAREMALASEVSLRLDSKSLPILPGAIQCIESGYVPGGLNSNRDFAQGCVQFTGVLETMATLMFDPQTAGGLLISVIKKDADDFLKAMEHAGVPAVQVGEVIEKTSPLIQVV
jgi:selenide,water dikinase